MKAVGYRKSLPLTEPDALLDLDLPMPAPGPFDLRVAVQAVSVNPVDTKIRARVTPEAGQVQVLGWDVAGVVDAVGENVTRFQPGDRVFYAGAVDRPGCDSEFHVVDSRIVGHAPRSLSPTLAAALPLTFVTAWELLFTRLGVPYGQKTAAGSLLIVGGAGGVGSALTQIARRLTGLTVIATASRPETVEWCRSMGAHHVIDHRQPLDEALKAVGIAEVTYVASLTGTQQHLPAIVRAIAPQGKMAVIDDPASLDIMPFKRKSVSVHWEFMYTRSLFGTPDLEEQGRVLDEVSALMDDGLLKTTFKQDLGPITAANIRRAHEILESGSSIGKLVLTGF